MPRLAGYLKIALGSSVLLLAVLVGCGSDGGDEATTGDTDLIEAQEAEVEQAGTITTPIDASDVVKTFPPTIVTDGDVDAEKQGTPERALLEWWQAFQFHDFEAVEALTSKATLDTIGADRLKELVATTLPGVEILDANESGATAQINIGLLSFQPPEPGEPPPRQPTGSTPQTFTMTQENGDWVVAASDYLDLRLSNLQG